MALLLRHRLLRGFFLVALLVQMLVGITPARAADEPSGPREQMVLPQPNPVGVGQVLITDMNNYWNRAFGGRFTPPVSQFYSYDAPKNTACGQLRSYARQYTVATYKYGNSTYCHADRSVSLDYPFHEFLFRNRGDYASGFIFAHEYAHHVQLLNGYLLWANQQAFYAGKELQADCYAGIYSRDAYNRRVLDAGDYNEARRLLYYDLGANNLAINHKDAHGTGLQRDYWFRVGFHYSNFGYCNYVYQSIGHLRSAANVAEAADVPPGEAPVPPPAPPEPGAPPAGSFPDVPADHPYHQAITALTGYGIIRGYADGTFGPGDPTLRAQMAALIARTMGWEAEDRGNPFPDRGSVDAALWRNVGTLAARNVARGYADGTYDPTGAVLYAQVISFITRAMVAEGIWQPQPDNPALYPNVPAGSGHRQDLATYTYYAGAVPGTTATGAWAGWAQPATRGWFAQALYQAISAAH